MTIRSIGEGDVHRITSGEVIVDLLSALKELIENSIDAKSSRIEILLKDSGLKGVEITDNGTGIAEEDFETLCLKHHTSKIENFEDLNQIYSLGFRGEALSSLCSIARVKIVTCTKNNYPKTKELSYDSMGNLVEQKQIIGGLQGTSIVVSDIFHNLPVRRKHLEKNIKKEYAKAVNGLLCYLLINPAIRFTIYNLNTNTGKKNLVVGTTGGKKTSILDNMINLFGSNGKVGLVPINIEQKGLEARFKLNIGEFPVKRTFDLGFRGYISNGSFGMGRASTDRQFLFINGRPVILKKFLKTINEVYKSFNYVQYPVVVLDIILATEFLDVNVTPDKRLIMMHNEDVVNDVLRSSLVEFYTQQCHVIPKTRDSTVSNIGNEVNKDSVILPQVDSSAPSEKDPLEEQERRGENFLENHKFNAQEEYSESELAEATKEEVSACMNYDMKKNAEASEGGVEDRDAGISVESSQDGDSKADSEQAPANADKMAPKSDNLDIEGDDSESSCERSSPGASPQQENDDMTDAEKSTHTKEGDHCGRILSNDFDSASVSEVESMKSEVNEEPHNDLERNGERPIPNFIYDSVPQKEKSTSVSPWEEDSENSLFNKLNNDDDSLRISIGHQNFEERPQKRYKKSRKDEINFGSPKEFKGISQKMYVHDKVSELHIDLDRIAAFVRNMDSHHGESEGNKTKVRLDDLESSSAEDKLTFTVNKDDFLRMDLIGQFNLGFILVTLNSSNNLFIVDQHASDEIFNFERFLRSAIFNNQRLLQPKVMELNVIEEMIVMDNLPVFRQNGFVLEVCEDNPPGSRIELVSFPMLKDSVFSDDDFHELVHLISESSSTEKNSLRCSKVRSILAMRACRSSIMIGQHLSRKTMAEIIKNLNTLDKPWNCPHGRPTMRHLTELKNWSPFNKDYEI